MSNITGVADGHDRPKILVAARRSVIIGALGILAGTLTVTVKGQTVVRTGTLAYTFSKHGPEWKINAQAWGRTS